MAYVTERGILWGMVPDTTGRVFWVSPSDGYTIAGLAYRASDENDGLSPERALRTVNRAWDLVAATCGDMIILLPGAHTTTAVITADVAGVTMMGLPRYTPGAVARPITSLTISASADIIAVSAANVQLAWLHLIPVTTMDSVSMTASTGTGVHIHHCSVDLDTAAASTSTQGFNFGGTTPNAHIHDCVFYCDSAQGEAIDGVTGMGQALIERCRFIQSTGTWAAALKTSVTADGSRGILVRDCDFIAAADATMTVGILGTAGVTEETIHIHRCFFSDSVGTAIDTFGARGAEIAENYQAGVGATDGGVLLTAIT